MKTTRVTPYFRHKESSKIKEAQEILEALGLPRAQQNEMSALTLLALCGLSKSDPWAKAKRKSWGVSKGIMDFIAQNYKRKYAPNTRETFRRQVLHFFVQAGIANYNPDNINLPVNSPKAHYAISKQALKVVKLYGSSSWKKGIKKFIGEAGQLQSKYQKKREQTLIPVTLSNGKELKLSAGKHNVVQAAVVEQFAARFTKGGQVLYLGDTANKNLYRDIKVLEELDIPIDKHSKLPDVLIYEAARNWLFLIEAVTSHGPVSPKRLLELEELLNDCKAGKIYVTAFPDFTEFKKHSKNIAWETEVWIVEFPEHMIHFNGDKFFGPR